MPQLARQSPPWLEQTLRQAAALVRVPGLPDEAILCIRRLQAGIDIDGARPGQGIVGASQALSQLLHRQTSAAVRPADGPVPESSQAILFETPPQMLVCAARDWLSGDFDLRWWWPLLAGRHPSAQGPVVLWQRHPEHIPRALAELERSGRQATTFCKRMLHADAEALLAALLACYPPPQRSIVSATPSGHLWLQEIQSQANASERLLDIGLRLAGVSRVSLEPTEQSAVRRMAGAGANPHSPATDIPESSLDCFPALNTNSDASTDSARGINVDAADRPPRSPRPQGDSLTDGRELAVSRSYQRRTPPPEEIANPATVSPASEDESKTTNATEPSSGDLAARRALLTKNAKPFAAAPVRQEPQPAHVRAERSGAESGYWGPDLTGRPASERDRANKADGTNQEAARDTRIDTGFGGVLFLLNVAIGLGLYPDFTRPAERGLGISPWVFLAEVGRRLLGRAPGEVALRDPLWDMLTTLAVTPEPDSPPPIALPDSLREFGGRHSMRRSTPAGDRRSEWFDQLIPPLQRRLSAALDVPARDAGPLLCRQTAQIRVAAPRLEARFSLDQHPIAIRQAGLDRDPGWIPAAGIDVRFIFVCDALD